MNYKPPSTAAGRQTKIVEGWTRLFNDELLVQDKAATERAQELLTEQLQKIKRSDSASAVTELQKVPLWFTPEYPGVQPRVEYHPHADWLRDNNRDPAMAKAVEFTNVRIFERETRRTPIFALHILARPCHDRVLPRIFANEQINAEVENGAVPQRTGLSLELEC